MSRNKSSNSRWADAPFQPDDRVEVIKSEGNHILLGMRGRVEGRQIMIERVGVRFDGEAEVRWVWEVNLRRVSLVDEIAELDRPEPIPPITGEGG